MFFSFGNRKLPKYTAIFNMNPATMCPSDILNLCQLKDSNKCYAKKAEKMYKKVMPYRIRQMKFWVNCTSDEFVKKFFNHKKKRIVKFLRFNEAGDFISQLCANKAIEIANKLIQYNIKTYCYTARRDLDFSQRNNLVVNGSNFMVDNNFHTAYSVQEIKTYKKQNYPICIGDCRKCRICTKKLGKKIIARIH